MEENIKLAAFMLFNVAFQRRTLYGTESDWTKKAMQVTEISGSDSKEEVIVNTSRWED